MFEETRPFDTVKRVTVSLIQPVHLINIEAKYRQMPAKNVGHHYVTLARNNTEQVSIVELEACVNDSWTKRRNYSRYVTVKAHFVTRK